ncbi:hypothetical protein AMJ44_05500 [candidate division WOR-1 bacterium DG_54_3]|uniref:Uncharacterized protein n=1 Tax=candidate division WOR-1 bacterium DG_54_3 TaxID=1703775 RepID=A0A0S7Y2M8_UNCSA|nr:MAG: hypothetical protein AMJ44_05500 [candidate division WOR-1 bacterium DG_54_3]
MKQTGLVGLHQHACIVISPLLVYVDVKKGAKMMFAKKISLRATMVNKIVGTEVTQESADGTCM